MVYGPQMVDNLNHLKIDNADGPDEPIRDGGRGHCMTQDNCINVFFDDLESRCVEEINKWPAVVGCMAWLTNEAILKAMATRQMVSILVNKEDFLRPDKGDWSQRKVKALYERLPSTDRFESDLPYSYASDPTYDAIRCAGISASRSSVPPRMHHKFLVFCDFRYERCVMTKPYRVTQNGSMVDGEWIWEEVTKKEYDLREEEEAVIRRLVPMVLWTGSFNATYNATQSLENAILVKNREVAMFYFLEWRSLMGISEPLDWRSPYVDAEWRLGT